MNQIYHVKQNGVEVPIHTCTVSGMPFNQIWPGYQRPKDQTEDAYFVSMDMEEPFELEIFSEEDYKEYEIRPQRAEISSRRENKTVTIRIERPMQFVFETQGHHHALHIFVNPKTEKPSGDVLYYGRGTHYAGLIWMKSHQTLYLEEGAVVYGTVFAKDAQDIKIMGRGILDSSPYRRVNNFQQDGREIYEQLQTRIADKKYFESYIATYSSIVICNCKDVLVEGIIVRDSMSWCVIVKNHCKNITIDNIKIIGQWRYNSDGINICASQNVIVRNCFIRSFDDCFIARGAYIYGETENLENLVVENCVMWCDWGKSLETWCGNRPCVIRNVSYKNIYLIHLSTTAIAISAKYGSEYNLVENISYENIYIDGESSYEKPQLESENNPSYKEQLGFIPFLVSIGADQFGKATGNQGFEPAKDLSGYHLIYRNISFKNVQYTGTPLKTSIKPIREVLEIENVSFSDCNFECERSE